MNYWTINTFIFTFIYTLFLKIFYRFQISHRLFSTFLARFSSFLALLFFYTHKDRSSRITSINEYAYEYIFEKITRFQYMSFHRWTRNEYMRVWSWVSMSELSVFNTHFSVMNTFEWIVHFQYSFFRWIFPFFTAFVNVSYKNTFLCIFVRSIYIFSFFFHSAFSRTSFNISSKLRCMPRILMRKYTLTSTAYKFLDIGDLTNNFNSCCKGNVIALDKSYYENKMLAFTFRQQYIHLKTQISY